MTARAAVRHAPDRLLHRWRRRAALRWLRERPFPRCVVVMCHGNIWRSPYAAAVLRRELASRVQRSVAVASAGLILPGRPCPGGALAVAATRGVDMTAHRSRVITRADLATADLIVVMNASQRRAVREMRPRAHDAILVLGDLDPDEIETREIRDPDDQPGEVCEKSYTRIDRCMRELVTALAGNGR